MRAPTAMAARGHHLGCAVGSGMVSGRFLRLECKVDMPTGQAAAHHQLAAGSSECGELGLDPGSGLGDHGIGAVHAEHVIGARDLY